MLTDVDMGGELRRATLKARIEERLKTLNLSAEEASKAARLGRTAISDIMRGKSGQPTTRVLVALSRVLKCDLAYLMGDQENPMVEQQVFEIGGQPIPVVGIIEAGVFREMREAEPWNTADSDAEYRTIIAPRSQTYPKASHFALQVRGDSMNAYKKRPIHEGDYALCVDVISAEHILQDGEIYAVRRTLDHGQSYEWTLKRARVFKDRTELTPDSTNPIHKPVVIPAGSYGDENEAVEIAVKGLMYASYSPFSRYS